jgi:hypothetical protein
MLDGHQSFKVKEVFGRKELRQMKSVFGKTVCPENSSF